MNHSDVRVTVCGECGGLAEPPLTRVYDPDGPAGGTVVCLECRSAILRGAGTGSADQDADW